MQITNSSITFSPFSGSGPRTQTLDVVFANPVNIATAILTGLNVKYSKHEDHHLGNLQVAVSSTPINPTTVRVTAKFGLRDWSGNWDDQYDGQIFFSVIGE